ncbi:MAG: tRNA threonylcarbamoyladenosine dehydratase [Eubacteriales bacterium]|nr:tRNA threonylcarbamoyladenosine dehydratase [Eubacteriales bacterium]MDD4582642.1 tRNA threonylcarbamoyladenosine dehydratase [Eubacteriales bacterium]
MATVYDRTEMLLGKDAMGRIKMKKVIIFGIGGVGGFVAEALARVGIGTIGIVDYDQVDVTNINRQIIALHSTIGKHKTLIMKERIKDINPNIRVDDYAEKLTEVNLESFFPKKWDYIVDAIDDVPAKLLLIQEVSRRGISIISSMGTGNHYDPGSFKIADIKKTHTCPLAKRIRKETAKMDIKELKVLFSTEKPYREISPETGNFSPASIAFAPATAGLMIAAEVVHDLIEQK